MLKSKKCGFTLVEIMVVVAIIVILTVVTTPNMLRARMNANQSATQATLRSLSVANESYCVANSNYAEGISNLTSGDSPYFTFDPQALSPRNGYTFVDQFTSAGYTFTAEPVSESTGNWGYQITTGGVLRRRADPPGDGAFETY